MSESMRKPWLANYVAFSYRCGAQVANQRYNASYWAAELFFLAILARGMQRLCLEEKIVGHSFNERLCRVSLGRIRRLADFNWLTSASLSSYGMEIKNAQRRLEGLLTSTESREEGKNV